MEKIVEFEKPTQVKFWDEDGHHWLGGIGIGTYIICGCCGATIPLDEIYEDASIENPVKPLEWLDIEFAIRGDE